MNKLVQIAAFSGLASGLLMVAATAVPLTIFVVALPLLVAGFITGLRGCLIACGISCGLVFVSLGLTGVQFFLMLAPLPAFAITRLLYRQPSGQDIPFWGAVYALLCILTVMAIIIGTFILDSAMKSELLQELITIYETFLPDIGPAERLQMAQEIMRQVPGTLAIFWIGLLMLNISAARTISQKFVKSRHNNDLSCPDTGDWTNIQLPRFWDIAVALMFLASYIPNQFGTIATFALMPMIFGLLLTGLATVHKAVKAKPDLPDAILLAVYLPLVFLSFLVAPLLIGLGIADHIYRLRDRLK